MPRIRYGRNVYIGLAPTSHNAARTCQAVFSKVTTTGNITGQWPHQDIGILSNDAEPLYINIRLTYKNLPHFQCELSFSRIFERAGGRICLISFLAEIVSINF